MRHDKKFFASFFQKRSLPSSPEPITLSATLDLFSLRTGANTFLGLEDGTVAVVDKVTPATALLATIPRLAPQNTMLMATDGRTIAIEGDGPAAPAISVRLKRVAGGGVELRHPMAPARWLGVVTGLPDGSRDTVSFDHAGDPALARFELQPITGDLLGVLGRVLLNEVALAVRAPMSAETLLARLASGTVRAELAASLLRALPADELAALGARLLSNPDDLVLLQRLLPDNFWLGAALPRLLDWSAQGRPVTRRSVSAASERPAAMLQTGQLLPQAGLGLLAGARRSVAPRRQAAVLAAVHNDGPYLLEWLAHHRAAGFEHAVIYGRDNDDGSDELLGLLADLGEITWVLNEPASGIPPQCEADGHAFRSLPDLLDYRWAMALDLDEYVGFRADQFGSVLDYLGWQEHQPTDSVALRRLHFAGGRMDMWRDAPSTRRFIRREPEVGRLFSSIVRPQLFWEGHAHVPMPALDLAVACRTEEGAAFHHSDLAKGQGAPNQRGTAELAWVSRYAYRSAGEALMKASRGRQAGHAEASHGVDLLDAVVRQFVGMADRPDLVIDERTPRCVRGLDGELVRLRGLAGVRDCDEAIKQRFTARMAAVSQAFLDATPAPERPREYTQFQNILRRQAEHRLATA